MKTTDNMKNNIMAYQAGDADAFSAVYEESYSYLHTCAIHILKNEDAVQDVLQDTYLEICKTLNKLDDVDKFLSWAAVICNRKCYAYLKRNQEVLVDDNQDDEGNVMDFFENVPDDEEMIPENVLDNAEKVRLVKGIIDGLTDAQRFCVLSFYYNELKQEDIAQQLGVPVNTVKSHLNRAKIKIKEAVVDLEEKKGTRLYSFAPFLLLFFTGEQEVFAKTARVPELSAAITRYLEELSKTSAGSGIIAKGAVKAAKTAVNVKMIAGIAVAAVAVAAAIGVGVMFASDSEKTKVNNDVTTVAENTTMEQMVEESEPETVTEKETETVKKKEVVPGYIEIDKEYTVATSCYNGVFGVEKDGMYGIMNLAGELVVPCEYSEIFHLNGDGYTILISRSLVNQSGTAVVFSPEGEKIYEQSSNGKDVRLMEGGFRVREVLDDDDVQYRYYNYDGTLFGTINDDNPVAFNPGNIAYGGKTMVIGTYEGPVEHGDGWNNLPGNILGEMDSNGNIDWKGFCWYPHGSEADIRAKQADKYNIDLSLEIRPMDLGVVSPINQGYGLVTTSSAWAVTSTYLVDENLNLFCQFAPLYYKLVDGRLVFSTSESDYDYSGGIVGYSDKGQMLYNYGTKMVWQTGGKECLVDLANQYGGNMDTEMKDILLCVYDRICMKNEKYWLVSKDGKWGYIDHDGNEVAMYDDASDFYDGYAAVIIDGKASIINDNLEVVEELGEASAVASFGELLRISNGEEMKFYYMDRKSVN